MKRFRATTLAAALGLAALAAGAAFAAGTTSTALFSASYAGTATEKVDGQKVTAVTTGTGTGTVVRKSKLSGVVNATTAEPPCSPLSGPGTIAGTVGKLKLTILPTSRGCAASEEDQNHISVSGTAKVVGGTLAFRKARGTLRFTGHYNRETGAFDVKLTGSITY